MGRPLQQVEQSREPAELDAALLALAAATAAGAMLISYVLWRQFWAGDDADRVSRRLLRELDEARSLLRRQLSTGQDARADETRIRIADLQRAIMQLEGYI